MRIGILETGAPPPVLHPVFGRYAGMVERMLGPDFAYQPFDVVGEAPPPAGVCDAYVITGSSAAAYDRAPWMTALEAFLRGASGRAPIIGLCFGHQIMAQAFGGVVEKSAKGWCAGLHTYRVEQTEPWMDAAQKVAIPASHQDQVIAPPPDARVTVRSDFTPFAGLAYPERGAISFQGHPEFEPAYARSLYDCRRGTAYGDDQADAAIASLAAPNDRARVANWLRSFLGSARVG